MGLGNRLALLVFVIVLGTFAIVYVGVVPSLEDSLRRGALEQLRDAGQPYARNLDQAINHGASAQAIAGLVQRAADEATTRVTLLGVARTPSGSQTFLKTDSAGRRDLQFAVALDAARTGQPVLDTESGNAGRVGEAAMPLFSTDTATGQRFVGAVAVFSTPLNDVGANVELIRRRILLAGIVALMIAALAGWVVARGVAVRVRRLEHVAVRVAQGDFSVRFPIDSRDELGQLASTLDDMRRQLAELDSARKRFIATASHELRTPLFSLGGFLELLEDEDVDEEDRARFLGQLRQQVARMQKLATDLLDLSKLEAGSLELRNEPTDLGTVARAVANEFTPALAAHGSHLELRLPAAPLVVSCDPERISQVMRILIDNAITHTPEGTDLVVSASRRGRRARLGVGDFGPGIHRTMLPRIFEPFVTTDDAQGSGLGLAIAGELAERMDGRLAVDSQPGRTTFTLELPA